MSNSDSAPTLTLTGIPRAVLSVATEVMFSVGRAVVGADRVRTARSNAWEAVCADQARARHREQTRRLVADLATASAVTATRATLAATTGTGARLQLTVGSSPRSSASQAALVGSASRT